jgi:hypothetical protein
VVGWWGRRTDEEGIDNWEAAVQRHVNNACEGAGILLSEALTSENDTRIVEEEKPRERRDQAMPHTTTLLLDRADVCRNECRPWDDKGAGPARQWGKTESSAMAGGGIRQRKRLWWAVSTSHLDR